MSLKLIKGMESIIKCEVLKVISDISSRYEIDVEDEYKNWELGVSGGVSGGVIPLPYSGVVVEGNCSCVKKNRGLYTQCGSVKEVGEMCRRCEGEVKRKGAIFGTMKERSLVGIMEYKDSKGNGPVSYLKVMKKLKLSREEVEGEALRRGVVIDAVHFEEGKSKRGRPSLEVKEVKEVKGKGRPSKSKKVLELEDETVDLFANMVKAALEEKEAEVMTDLKEAAVVEVVTDLKETEVMTDLKETEVVVNDKEEKESQKLKEKETKLKEKETKLKEKEEKESQKLKEKEEKEAQKLKEKEEKESQKLKEKEEKEAQKLKEKEEKEAQKLKEKEEKEVAKLKEKEAQKLKEKEEKEVAKLKEKEAKDEAKDFAPLLQKVDLQKVEVEEEDSVTEFEYEGKKYLRSVIDGTVYDMDEEEIGKWDKVLKKIVLSDNNSEEEEEDYE